MLSEFEIGIYNSRGVVTRGHHDGGDQERALADKFEGRARAIEITEPKTAAVLRRVAEHYRQRAKKMSGRHGISSRI